MVVKIKILIVLLILTIPLLSYSKDRCLNYQVDERTQFTKYFGPGFPYVYGLGQLKQESGCRDKITAFDKGEGIAQFMPQTAKYIESLMGEKLNPYNATQAIHMQAFYMYRIHSIENFTSNKPLWIDFQIYNGGASILKKEYKRAKASDWTKMRAQCRRNKIKLKSGEVLDSCNINYNYSKNIFNFGNEYNPLPSLFLFW